MGNNETRRQPVINVEMGPGERIQTVELLLLLKDVHRCDSSILLSLARAFQEVRDFPFFTHLVFRSRSSE